VRVAYGVALAGLVLLDAALSGSVGQIAYLLAVVALAVLVARRTVPAWTVGALSAAATLATLATATLAPAGIRAPFALSEGLVLLVAVITTTRRAAGARGAAAVALVALATVALPVRLLSADTPTFGILLVAVVACALAVGATLRNADADRRLALAVATQRERDGLARDLHDDFTNRVTGMILLAQAARRRADAPGSALDAELAGMEEAGGQALASMRRWVRTLRDTGVERDPELADDPDDRDEGIRALLDRWQSAAPGRRAELDDTTRAPVPAEVRATAARIVQESVTNATRHAPGADRIRVALAEDPDRDAVVVTVVSPLDPASAGADPVPGSPGLGLVGMRERAAILGGTLEAGVVDRTWTVRATLPRDAGA
jgi:signal transduction histidine kinase